MDNFHVPSFVIGILVGLLAAVILPVRERIAALLRAIGRRIAAGQEALTRSADASYRIDLVQDCQTMHLAGNLMNLTDILIEPRFLPAEDLPTPSGRDIGSIMHVVPVHHDMPHSYAPFNLETIGVNDLPAGGTRVAILGGLGAGKTTALNVIALMALGELDFAEDEAGAEADQDKVDEAELSQEEREARRQARERQAEIEARALEHLRSLQAGDEYSRELAGTADRIDWLDYTPLFLHLGEIELSGETWSDKVDPAEPVVRAIQRRVGPITRNTIPKFVYDQVAKGRALLLLDGFDELPAALREEKLTWLRHFVELYPDNLFYVAAATEGCGPLLDLDFVPVYLRPWTDQESMALAEKWAEAWPLEEERRDDKGAPLPKFDERAVRRAGSDNRSRSPLDITLKTWMIYATDGRKTGRAGWYDVYVERVFTMAEAEHREKGRRLIEMVAARILDTTGYAIDRDAMEEALTKLFTVTETVTVKTRQGEEQQEKQTLLVNVGRFVKGLTGRCGLMDELPGGRLAFHHPMMMAYLAAEAVANDPTRDPADLVDKPNWRYAFPFLAALTSVDKAVVAKLSAQPDLLYGSLFEVASWLIDAPPAARWRGEVFKRLARALMAPSQYRVLREKALGAIIASRDENVIFVYRQALRSTDPDVRRLACLGMGALGSSEAIKDLTPMLADDDLDVQLAAGLALGAIGTERALEMMVRGMLEGEENLRRAVAEALAALPGEGHNILRDAAVHSDMFVRRAAVFGLRRIKEKWALVGLYRVMLEDGEWYVKSAAQEAFAHARNPEIGALKGYPETESLPWLVTWAAERGNAVPAGDAANQVLIQALQQGKPPVRMTAADTLGVMGYVPALKSLYLALRDEDAAVRDTAFEALATLQLKIGRALPAVM
ncbi:MAG: HEAT repeat domain-containing protein [Anaerolineae bacterium]|nr:HEAT repeat domain-containing protein [Anaerolineae bacterium]